MNLNSILIGMPMIKILQNKWNFDFTKCVNSILFYILLVYLNELKG
jgi:hypothetical protein